MFDDNGSLPFWWVYLAALAGAVSSLPFFRGLVWGGRIMVVFVGFTFSVFVGPLIIRKFAGPQTDLQMLGGFFFLIAFASMTVLPLFLMWCAVKFNSNLGGMVKPPAPKE